MYGLGSLNLLQPSGTRLTYEAWVKPKNIFGDIGIPLAIGIVSAKRFGDAFKMYDRIASNGSAALSISTGRNLPLAGHNKFNVLSERLKEQGASVDVLDRLYEFLHRADDLSIQRMRPYAKFISVAL